MALPDDIKKFRKAAHLTQSQLAEKVGISLMSIRRYEAGTREPPLSVLQRIADALDLAFDMHTDPNGKVEFDFFDAPSNIKQLPKYDRVVRPSTDLEKIADSMEALNELGRKTAVERVRELTQIPKYKFGTDPDDGTQPD